MNRKPNIILSLVLSFGLFISILIFWSKMNLKLPYWLNLLLFWIIGPVMSLALIIGLQRAFVKDLSPFNFKKDILGNSLSFVGVILLVVAVVVSLTSCGMTSACTLVNYSVDIGILILGIFLIILGRKL